MIFERKTNCDHFKTRIESYSWRTKCVFHQERSRNWYLSFFPWT